MNENIDLTKILKDCPKGWKFYSSVYGEVEFETIEFQRVKYRYDTPIHQIVEEDPRPIKFTVQDAKRCVSSAGEHIKGKGECTFFPSKDQRDWSKFTAPWLKKEPEHKFHEGDWVVYNNDICQIVKREEGCNKLVTVFGIEKELVNERNLSTTRLWTIQDAKDGDVLSFYSEYKGNKMVQVGIIEKYVGKHGGCSNTFKIYVGVNWDNKLQIGEYMGCSDIHPATKEQHDALMKAINDAGYKWKAETKTLEKLIQPKFDPKILKPFDKVLVRDERLECWRCAFYSHQRKESTSFRYATTANSYARCIPYNDETKHLVGTTGEAPEYYRYWED